MDSESIADIKRKLRLIWILDGAEAIGFAPLAVASLHTIAYFAEALAPVWGIPVIDGRILKRHVPYYPALQNDLDQLVGAGLVVPSSIGYSRASDGSWRLVASYRLNRFFADRVIHAARSLPQQEEQLQFTHEVVFAVSGLGIDGLPSASALDAAYSDPMLDVGDVIEVEPEDALNRTAEVALRFGSLLPGLTTAEMTNLYVRRLYDQIATPA